MSTLTSPADARRETVDRIQLDLPSRSMERLNALKPKTEAASYPEALIEATEQGRRFLIRDESGSIAPFRMFV